MCRAVRDPDGKIARPYGKGIIGQSWLRLRGAGPTGGGSNGDQVGVRFACAGRADRKAVALGDRYTNTLGLLTPPAYRKAAEDGGLLAAVEADEALGYARFGLPKRSTRIRLAHLCVAEEQRGRGIARRLVEGIKERYPQRLGSKAKCRRDYNLSGMWRSLDSVPDGEVRRRGRDGEILDGSSLDLGHPDLFTEMESDALLAVTVDHGVFADLQSLADTAAAEEFRALEAG
ncbi:GNAT family N-acetyltransferase [Streptomyces sp. NPDC001817]|uniref:GNAT family N-acetyltransferase n=1 Tax=Streptomyces sp. NPDC001817 TaxID=3154398 RepID=UPI0033166207